MSALYQRPTGITRWHARETTAQHSFVLPEQGVGITACELARLPLAPRAGSSYSLFLAEAFFLVTRCLAYASLHSFR